MLSKTDMGAMLDRMGAAYRAGDAAACAAMFSQDAQIHSPYPPPAIGRAAIEALHQEWTAEASEKSFTVIDCGSTNTMAWCLCRFAEGPKTGEGTSLIVLESGPAGDWLIRSCCLYGDHD
ncbi:MAG: nuclear transport factor 2 family protein [Roseobacter sp.]